MNLDCRACLESSFPFTMLYGLCVPDIQSYKARVLKVAPEDWRLAGQCVWGGGEQSEDSDSLWLCPQTLCQELLKTPK